MPVKDLFGDYCIQFIVNTYEIGFRAVLVDNRQQKRVEVSLIKGVDFYSYADESLHCMRSLEVTKHQGGSFFTKDWAFYEIIHSPHVDLLKQLSGGTMEDIPLKHYVLKASDAFLDIIDPGLPEVRVMHDSYWRRE